MSDSPEELQADQASPFVTMWFMTKQGTRYEMPDMLPANINEAHRQLTGGNEYISVVNVSTVAMILPSRILKCAGSGKRTFWEAT